MKKINKSKILKSIKKKIPFVFFMLIVGVSCFYVGRSIGLNTDTSSSNTTVEDVKVSTQTIKKTLTSSGEIKQSATNKLSLSTSYVFNSVLVEEDEIVKKGTKLVKYSNGKYLVAPYDLVVSKINVPSKGKKATSSNYIQVYNVSNVLVSINVSESEIANIKEGDEVEIVLTSDSSKIYTGKISKISSVGTYSSSGSTFEVEVTIKNDGNIKVGMSVNCTINIEELTDVIAVPINAIQINGDRRYVVVVDGDKTEEVEVTTGLSDDNYVEIKSGLTTGETVRVVTVTTQSTIRSNSNSNNRGSRNGQNFGSGNMPGGFSGERPDGNNRNRNSGMPN